MRGVPLQRPQRKLFLIFQYMILTQCPWPIKCRVGLEELKKTKTTIMNSKVKNRVMMILTMTQLYNHTAYQWFVANVQRELYLEPATITEMETVANVIWRRVCSLPSVRSISRTRPPETCIIAFEIDWNPLAFVREQHYPQEPHEAIEIAITLTGGARDAQALTSGQYLCQTWPINGEHTMQLVKDVVRGLPGSRHSCMSFLLRLYMVCLMLTVSLQANGLIVLNSSHG